MCRILTFAAVVAFATSGCAAASTAAPPPAQISTAFTDWLPTGQGNLTPRALKAMQGAGASIVRMIVPWGSVAPARPDGFDAAAPGASQYDWRAVDAEVTAITKAGLQPMLDVTGAPSWAQDGQSPQGWGPTKPSPADLAGFATAIATRYGGGYHGLPRVRYWELYNEPNLYLYLNPQLDNGRPFAPAWYRSMVNAFARAAHRVHTDNLVAVGGLTPFQYKAGDQVLGMLPMQFMQKFLCMSGGPKPRPTCKDKVEFDAWTHHPYTSGGPTHKASTPGDVSLGDLGEMSALLDAAERAGHIVSRRPPAFWVTELSWDSAPPDPKGVPADLEARWVAEATYRMWQNGVSLFTWFTVVDQPMSEGSYQSGLYFNDWRPKPAREAFRFPVAAFPAGGGIDVWGRTPFGGRGRVAVEQSTGGRWRRLAVLTTNAHGIFQRQVEGAPHGGPVRAKLLSTGELSVPFSLLAPPDRVVDPFGSRS